MSLLKRSGAWCCLSTCCVGAAWRCYGAAAGLLCMSVCDALFSAHVAGYVDVLPLPLLHLNMSHGVSVRGFRVVWCDCRSLQHMAPLSLLYLLFCLDVLPVQHECLSTREGAKLYSYYSAEQSVRQRFTIDQP
jgi:hypothetical protein